MICVNTFALNGNLTVTYKTLIFNNLYLYEFCENFADFIRWHANAGCGYIIRKTKCFRILERNAKISKTKRNFSRLYPTPKKFKKIDRLRRNEIHLKAVRTSS